MVDLFITTNRRFFVEELKNLENVELRKKLIIHFEAEEGIVIHLNIFDN